MIKYKEIKLLKRVALFDKNQKAPQPGISFLAQHNPLSLFVRKNKLSQDSNQNGYFHNIFQYALQYFIWVVS